jgi:hypothetical protein
MSRDMDWSSVSSTALPASLSHPLQTKWEEEVKMCAQHANGEHTAVERIAAFTSNAKSSQLTAEVRALLKRNVLDSVGCAIAVFPNAPFLKPPISDLMALLTTVKPVVTETCGYI